MEQFNFFLRNEVVLVNLGTTWGMNIVKGPYGVGL